MKWIVKKEMLFCFSVKWPRERLDGYQRTVEWQREARLPLTDSTVQNDTQEEMLAMLLMVLEILVAKIN